MGRGGGGGGGGGVIVNNFKVRKVFRKGRILAILMDVCYNIQGQTETSEERCLKVNRQAAAWFKMIVC